MANTEFLHINNEIEIPIVGEITDDMPDVSFCPICGYVQSGDGLCHNDECGVVDADPAPQQR